MLAGATAAGLSAALVFGHATNTTVDTQIQLAAAVIGVGGRGDPTAARIETKLNGLDTAAVSHPYTYVPVHYPASFFIDSSVAAGVPVLDDAIKTSAADPTNAPDPTRPVIVVVGYSEGTIVAENEKRNLATDPDAPPPTQLSFLMIASPNVPNGGIFGRFPNLNLLIVSSNGPAQPSKYDTTYVTNEYDPYADFPAYFNPFSLANSLAAVVYVHPDKYYDDADLATAPTPKVVTNAAGGKDTYYFIPAEHLPLLQLPRDISAAFGLTPLTEPFISAIEPVLRVLVDMGYTDRVNANPEVPTRFSLITPAGKIVEAVVAMPGAVAEGASNFVDGFTPAAPASTPSINAASDPPAPQRQSNGANAEPPAKDPEPRSVNPPSDPPNAAPRSEPQQSNPPQSTPPSPDPKPTRPSPFTLDKKVPPPSSKTNATQPGGRWANAVRDALTGLSPEKPKPPQSSTPAKPSTPQSDTDPAAQGPASQGPSTQGQPGAA